MWYVKEITTSADSANSTNLKVWGGVIVEAYIRFPPGPEGQLKVRVSQGGHQIIPMNDSTWFTGDDEAVGGREFIVLGPGWNMLTIHTQNDDEVNSHWCKVRINVLPLDVADPRHQFKVISTRLGTLLRRVGVT